MARNKFYRIGLANTPWNASDKAEWLRQTSKQRCYHKEVVNKFESLQGKFDLVQYGALSIDPSTYPLFALVSQNWDVEKPTILITGGVHGYETSGVHGAIDFMVSQATAYLEHFNIVTLPCVSPWGYEHIARWNPDTVDPNRSFIENSPSEEATAAMAFINSLEGEILIHIDLHETTDTDKTEFRPALAARDGNDYMPGIIPDGFYLVGDTENKQIEFQKFIINAVREVTHIADSDCNGMIIGAESKDEGIIYYPLKKLGLCASMSDAKYTTTTEVYPNSANVTDAQCNHAQIAAIKATLDFVLIHQR